MSTVGQIEKKTQQRVVELLRDTLGYDYLGNWIDRPGNRNIETSLLSAFLKKQGYDDAFGVCQRSCRVTSRTLF